MDNSRPIFLQIAEGVEDSIIDGEHGRGGAGAVDERARGVLSAQPRDGRGREWGMLVDKGVLYKRRGIGMFVAAGCARTPARRSAATAFAGSLRRAACSPKPAKLGSSAPTTSAALILDHGSTSAPEDHHGRNITDDRRDRGHGLTKRYRDACGGRCLVHDREDTIYGLLGRNGAGKTTVMSILTAQNFATPRRGQRLRREPVRERPVLSRMCFVARVRNTPTTRSPCTLRSARPVLPALGRSFAKRLIADFQLPVNGDDQELSRGQLSAVGVIMTRFAAEITFFDEPYLGLDAVARQIFYDGCSRITSIRAP